MPLSPDKIKDRREALQLTQAAAAERAGVPQPRWAEMESGRNSDPILSRAEAVALALRCPLAKLLAPSSPPR